MKRPTSPVVSVRVSRAPRYAARPTEEALRKAVGEEHKELAEKYRREMEYSGLKETT